MARSKACSGSPQVSGLHLMLPLTCESKKPWTYIVTWSYLTIMVRILAGVLECTGLSLSLSFSCPEQMYSMGS